MSENEVLGQEPQFAALVGIDWADQKHAWCLQAAGTTKRESGAHAGGGRGLGGATLSTIRQSADRGGGGTSEGSVGIHAQQVWTLAFVSSTDSDVGQSARGAVSVGSEG